MSGPDPPKDVGVTLDVLDTIRIQQASSTFNVLSRDARIATRKGTTRTVIATGRSPVLAKAQILDPRGMLPAAVKQVTPPELAAVGLVDNSGFLGADFAPAAGVSTTQRHAVIGTRDGFLLLYDDDAESFAQVPLGFANPGFSLNAVCFTWVGTTVIAGNSNGQIYRWGTDFAVAATLVAALPAGTVIRDIAFLNGTTIFLLATSAGLFQFDIATNVATLIFAGNFDRVAVDRLPPDTPSSARAIVTEALSDEGGPVTPAFFVIDMQLATVGPDTFVSGSSYQKRQYPDFGQQKTIGVAFMPNVGQSSGLLGRSPSVAVPPNDGWFFTGLDGLLFSYSASRNEFYGPFTLQTRSDLAHARAFLDAFRDTLFAVGQGGAVAAFNVDSLTGDGYMASTGEAVSVRSLGPSEVTQLDAVKMAVRASGKVERTEAILGADAALWFMPDAAWDDDPATFTQRGTTAVVASPTYTATLRRSYGLAGVHVTVSKTPFDTPIVGRIDVRFRYDDGAETVVVAAQATVAGRTEAYALADRAVPVREVRVDIDPAAADGATRWRMYNLEIIKSGAGSGGGGGGGGASANPVSTAHFTAVAVPVGVSRMPSGAAFVDPTGLSGLGVSVGSDRDDTVTADCRFDADPAVTEIRGFIDWYSSPDNGATYHYAGSNVIDDTVVVANPTGFAAAGEDSWRSVGKPERIFSRFVAIVIRNTGAPGGAFTATITINRQR